MSASDGAEAPGACASSSADAAAARAAYVKARAAGKSAARESKKQKDPEAVKKYEREVKAANRKRKREAQQQQQSTGIAVSGAALLPPPPTAAAAAASLPFEPPQFSLPYGWLPGSCARPSAVVAAPLLPRHFLSGTPLPWQHNVSLTSVVPSAAPSEGGTRSGQSSKALAAQTVATHAPAADGAAVAFLPPPVLVRAAAAAASSSFAASPAAAALELSPTPRAKDAGRQDAEACGAVPAAVAVPAATGALSAQSPTLLRCPQDGRCGYSSVLLCLLTPSCRDATSAEAAFAQRWRELGERILQGPVELPAAFTSQPSPFVTTDAALVRSLHRLLRAYLTEPSGSLHPYAAMLQAKEWQLTDGGQRSRALSRSTHAPFIALLEEHEPAVKLLSGAVDYLHALVAACSNDVRYSAEFGACTTSRHGWMDSRTKAFEILAAVLGLSLTIECAPAADATAAGRRCKSRATSSAAAAAAAAASAASPFSFEVTPPQRWMRQSASDSSVVASGKQWSQKQLWSLRIRCTRGGESDAPAPESAGTHWIGVLTEALQTQSAEGDVHMQPAEGSEEERKHSSSACPAAAASVPALEAMAPLVVSHDACEAKLELCKSEAAHQLADVRSEQARERTTWQEQLQAAQAAKDAADEALVTLRQQHEAAQASFEAERVGFRAKSAVQAATAAADRQQALHSMHAGHTGLLAAIRQLQQAAPSAITSLLQQMSDTQAALAQPLGDIFVNQSLVDTWLEQYDTVTAHVALLADESMAADAGYNVDSYDAINAQLSAVLRLLDADCTWMQQILVAQLLTIRPLYDYVAAHVKWYRTHSAALGADPWRRSNTHLTRLCARYCHLSLEGWSLLHALEVPDAALRERCRASADQLYLLANDTREATFSSATVSLVYDRCLFLAKHGGADGIGRATAAAKAAAAARTYPVDVGRSLVASVKRVLALPPPASALPAECGQDRKLKRALKKASDAEAATAFAALLAAWPWPQTVKLKTHCLLHDDDEEGAASTAWRRVETLRDEVDALLARFPA